MIELNTETTWILGRPNFVCGPIADALREIGNDIKRKAEEEQAFVIHWMLGLWEIHGATWKDEADKILGTCYELRVKRLEKQEQLGKEKG